MKYALKHLYRIIYWKKGSRSNEKVRNLMWQSMMTLFFRFSEFCVNSKYIYKICTHIQFSQFWSHKLCSFLRFDWRRLMENSYVYTLNTIELKLDSIKDRFSAGRRTIWLAVLRSVSQSIVVYQKKKKRLKEIVCFNSKAHMLYYINIRNMAAISKSFGDQ